MRLIPGKTKVKIEIFRKVTLSDVIVGLIGLIAVTLCVVSSLPGRWIIAMFVLALFALMLFRLDDDPMYVFLWHMLRYKAYPKRFSRVFSDELMLKGRDFAVDMVFNEEGEKPVVNKGESDHVTPSELAAIIGGEEDDAAFYAALEEAKKGETTEANEEAVTEASVEVSEDSAFVEEIVNEPYSEAGETLEGASEVTETETAEAAEESAEAVTEAEEESSKSKKKSKKDKKKNKTTETKSAETKTAEAKTAAATGAQTAGLGLSASAMQKTAIGPLLESMGAAKEAYLKAPTEAEKKKALKKLIS